ncbi:hypothetical protein TSOC_000348 [Tetrabaena socialis]|uniref:Uncharacterized protein n=1 Tax=Tetrabaena socialis TaxID=47790 RepID=A0A2J8AJL1_9CHLO|nr:hypothetical protein TSOC_000348 [Tetrabaena socialis]|eukprot:PNH12693.1 hypothetical protein TSOC_000348 [Tetrabaena socialis]
MLLVLPPPALLLQLLLPHGDVVVCSAALQLARPREVYDGLEEKFQELQQAAEIITRARTNLRDAANEAHVRSGGKTVVLTLLYTEGAAPAPAQAIAYGKPAAAFVDSHKELLSSFEAACRQHFREQQPQHEQDQGQGQQQQSRGSEEALQAPQQQQQQQQQQPGAQLLLPPSLHAAFLQSISGGGTAPGAAWPGLVAPRPVAPGPPVHPLRTSANLAASSGTGPASETSGPADPSAAAALLFGPPPGLFLPPAPVPPPLAPPGAQALHSVDLDSVIGATLADPAAAAARCRSARLSGGVLVRLPQGMQLSVLMQAGLLPGEAAAVVVELESRLRLLQLQPPPPLLNIAALS